MALASASLALALASASASARALPLAAALDASAAASAALTPLEDSTSFMSGSLFPAEEAISCSLAFCATLAASAMASSALCSPCTLPFSDTRSFCRFARSAASCIFSFLSSASVTRVWRTLLRSFARSSCNSFTSSCSWLT